MNNKVYWITCLIYIFFWKSYVFSLDMDFGKKYSDVKIDSTKDYLIRISPDSLFELGSPSGFINKYGDTVFPVGKYSHCWTDTLKTFAIVYDEINTNGVTVAIDKNGNILFDIYFFDNYPDEISNGLFRVKRNNLIGFANENGEIVIPCKFECAFRFENSRAEVAFHCSNKQDESANNTPLSEEWFFIDKNGNIIK